MKLHQEKVFSSMVKCPVRIAWSRGRPPRSSLAYHTACEFQFIVKGRGFYFIAGKKYEFRPNMLFSIHPNQSHCYAPAPGCMMEKWLLMFSPEFLDSAKLRRLAVTVPCQVSLQESETAAMVLLLRRMEDELSSRQAHWMEIVRLKLTEFLWLLERFGTRPLPPPVVNPLAKQIADHIEHDFARQFSMAELASVFGYSASHLAHVFKDHMQVGIKQYVLQRRIAEARRQLEENPHVKTSAVAESVGFNNFSIFNRKFKQLTGITPAVYRRNSYRDCKL